MACLPFRTGPQSAYRTSRPLSLTRPPSRALYRE